MTFITLLDMWTQTLDCTSYTHQCTGIQCLLQNIEALYTVECSDSTGICQMLALPHNFARLQDHLNAKGLPKGFPGSQQPGAAPSTARSVLTSASLSGSSSCEDPSGTLHSRFITPLTSEPNHPPRPCQLSIFVPYLTTLFKQ